MKKLVDLIVVGAGNPDIVRLIEDINEEKKMFNFIGFLDKNNSLHETEILGYPVLGDDELLIKYKKCAVVNNVIGTTLLHEMVTNTIRKKYGIVHFPNLIHPSTGLKYVSLGQGNIIYENVCFGTNVSIGNFNVIYPFVLVAHQSTIGSFNLLAASVSMGSRVTIGNRNEWGVGSILLYYLNVCDDVFVSTGSVVMSSINSPTRVIGNPAMPIKDFAKMQFSLEKLRI